MERRGTIRKRRGDVLSQRVGEEAVLYDPVSDATHILSPAAAFLWEKLDGVATGSAIAAAWRDSGAAASPEEAPKEIGEAARELDRAGLLEPLPPPENPVDLARFQMDRNRFAEAVGILAPLAEAGAPVTPRRPEILMLLGIARLAVRDNTGAEEAFRAGKEEFPAVAAFAIRLADLRLLAKDFNGAREGYEQALAADPENATLLANLGTVYAVSGREDLAEECWRKALLIAPGHTGALGNLAALKARQGGTDEAIDLYGRAIQDGGGGLPAHAGIVSLLAKKGDAAALETSLRQAVAAVPGEPGFHTLLGSVMLAKRDLAAARDCFREALRLRPGFSRAELGMAEADAAEGRWEEAAGRAAAILAANPADVRARIILSGDAERDHRVEEAVKILEEGMAIEECTLPCANALAGHYRRRRKPADAFAVYLRVAPLLADAPPGRYPHLSSHDGPGTPPDNG